MIEMFLRTPLKSLYNFISYPKANAIRVIMAGSLLKLANAAEACFEKDDHDHKLITRLGLNINNIVNTLTTECHIYNDGYDDCANFFVNSKDFGKGFFGGTTCTIKYHVGNILDSCISTVLEKNCPNGYGTTEDILATIGIAIGGGLCLAGLGYFLVKYCRNRSVVSSDINRASDLSDALIPVPYQSDESNPVGDRAQSFANSSANRAGLFGQVSHVQGSHDHDEQRRYTEGLPSPA